MDTPRQSEARKQTIQAEFDSDVYDVTSLNQLIATLNIVEARPS
jgi:hypothetical protein